MELGSAVIYIHQRTSICWDWDKRRESGGVAAAERDILVQDWSFVLVSTKFHNVLLHAVYKCNLPSSYYDAFCQFQQKKKKLSENTRSTKYRKKTFFLSGTCLYVCNCGFANTYNWPCSGVLVKLVLGNQWWSTKAVERLFYMHALYTRSPKTQDPVWILTESIATNCCFQSMLLSWIGITHLKPIASLLSGVILGWMCYSGRLGRIWNQIPNPSINGRPTHFATWAASDYVILSYVECICTVETLMPFLKNENVLSALSECRNICVCYVHIFPSRVFVCHQYLLVTAGESLQ